MKILHVCNTDLGGGAGIAAHRLHKALLNEGVDSRMLVLERRDLSDDTITEYNSSQFKFLRKVFRKIDYKLAKILTQSYGSFCSASVCPSFHVDQINRENPDIVHLHWINRGVLSIGDLAKIKAPIVWSLHDLWPFSPGRHYLGEASEKPVSLITKLVERGISTFKKLSWKQLNLTWVPLSSWMEKELRASDLHFNFPIQKVWNSVPADVFATRDKTEARERLGLALDQKIILFGAERAMLDKRKGSDLLFDSLDFLPPEEAKNTLLVSFGGTEELRTLPNGYTHKDFGHVSDVDVLVDLYSAAECFACPSREDNLPNCCVEAVMCGTPVVAFEVGGIPDIVVPGKSGLLVSPFSSEDFSEALNSVIAGDFNLDKDCVRKFALERFSPDVHTNTMINLYEEKLAI